MKKITEKFSCQTGFTLIELMIVVSVVAILLVIAVPAMTSFLNSNRLNNHSNALKQALHYARSEAVAKNQDVAVCPSPDGATCSTGVDIDWAKGWIVSIQGAKTVLKVWGELPSGFSFASAPDNVVFDATGKRTSPADKAKFILKDPEDKSDEKHSRTLTISNVGWVSVSKGGGDGK